MGKKKEIDLVKIEELAAQGLTKDQIILCLDVGKSTFYRNAQESGEVGLAFDRGRAKGVKMVTDIVMNHHIKKMKSLDAAKFYLKTQTPQFREQSDITHKGDADQPIEMKTTYVNSRDIPALAAEVEEILNTARQRKAAASDGFPERDEEE